MNSRYDNCKTEASPYEEVLTFEEWLADDKNEEICLEEYLNEYDEREVIEIAEEYYAEYLKDPSFKLY